MVSIKKGKLFPSPSGKVYGWSKLKNFVDSHHNPSGKVYG